MPWLLVPGFLIKYSNKDHSVHYLSIVNVVKLKRNSSLVGISSVTLQTVTFCVVY